MINITYHSTKRSDWDAFLEVERNEHNEIVITIQQDLADDAIIYLDKKTAIKLAKQLRAEISFINDAEVQNG